MKKTHTKDFIQTIVDLYHKGKSVTDLSLEYDVEKDTIYRWINQAKKVVTMNDEEISKDDSIALKKRIQELEEENEILKRAISRYSKRK